MSVESNSSVKSSRIEWLDALRGFTMILVVANHVGGFAFEQTMRYSSSMSFLVIFRMPLFFFISGFLAYRASQVWTLPNLGRLTLKKIRVQLIPTIAFMMLAAAMMHRHFWPTIEKWLHNDMKGGFWFTLVLLYMFLIYYVFAYIESKIKWRSWIPITILFIVSLLVYETCFLPREFAWAFGRKVKDPSVEWLFETSFIQVMQYFPFFLYGNIVRRYWNQAQRVMDSSWFYPILVLVVVISAIDVLNWHTMRREWTNLPNTLAKFCLLTMVFMYFRHYAKYFTQQTIVGRTFQYIGRRTLDIYLIHYFFMPNLPTVGHFFDTYRHNFAIDLTAALIIAFIVIGFSVIASNILRVSPLFKKYLFGR